MPRLMSYLQVLNLKGTLSRSAGVLRSAHRAKNIRQCGNLADSYQCNSLRESNLKISLVSIFSKNIHHVIYNDFNYE